MSDVDVIIIGGGIAGLSAALHLAERGLKPLILEADEKFIGGRLAGGGVHRRKRRDRPPARQHHA